MSAGTRFRVIVVGCGGRMGSEVCRLLEAQPDLTLAGGVEASGHKLIGAVLGSGTVSDQFARAVGQADCVVDFSTAQAVAANAELAAEAGKPYVTGVTGLSEDANDALRRCAARIPLVCAPNFSVGISVLARLVTDAARLLGPGFDVQIVETHHRQKKDAPSGTALRLRDAVNLPASAPRVEPGAILSVRVGDVVGDHAVIFGGPGERLELTHRATSRLAFASGVLAAVRFVRDRGPGFYTVEDVLDHCQPGRLGSGDRGAVAAG